VCNVPLVCVIKCHCTSALLPSAVLSCAAVSLCTNKPSLLGSGVPRIFFGEGGVQQIQLRTEDREKGDLGAVAP